MSEEKDEGQKPEEIKAEEIKAEEIKTEEIKAEEEAKAAAELPQSPAEAPATAVDAEREGKLKAAAEARAARAAAKEAANAGGAAPEGAVDAEREAKLKAAAEARAARAAAKEAANAGGAAPEGAVDAEREAKLKAAAEARAARAAAKEAANAGGAAPEGAEPPPEPSPKQPELDAAAKLIRSLVHEEALEDAYVNEMSRHMPTIIVKNEHWAATAELLKRHEELHFTYLRNISGVDYETHLEVVYHLVHLESRRELAVKVKADRSDPVIASATPVWATANWNEREIYDLLGVTFPGHPDLRRIMMSDDWVGHPLRKDYEPLDSEV
ncbi:NADH-quinone oxidoreductase subunit C [Paenibacillus glycanilyticus]|uniref:NADH-quinone oxidoreductase subunit C n=1 Tax=Paenibacillus glycanilyticus TaxID=126569 RepID=UPI0019109346|nr:NADH-quinone oxidoreductase subunit C [Paenibacillus glycanilyticus]